MEVDAVDLDRSVGDRLDAGPRPLADELGQRVQRPDGTDQDDPADQDEPTKTPAHRQPRFPLLPTVSRQRPGDGAGSDPPPAAGTTPPPPVTGASRHRANSAAPRRVGGE